MKTLFISDTTLRTQCDGLKKVLSFRERLNIAAALEKAGVDAIELPSVSGGKENTVICRTIAASVGVKVCVAADSTQAVETAWEAVSCAAKPCIQVVLPVSTVQMEYMYHLKSAKMLEKIAAVCKAAQDKGAYVEFVARDASRAEPGFAAACCKTAMENGASALTLCDDNGAFFPEEFAAMVREIKAVCPIPVYVQPSNALNMAAACAVEAIRAGADGIKTASGCDELSADTVADIVRARGDALGVTTALDVTAIRTILGAMDAPAAAAPTQEGSTQPVEEIALVNTATLTDVAAAVGSLGYELSDEDMGKVYEEFRRVSRRKTSIGARELEAIIATAAMQVPSTFHLVSYVVNSGNVITATAHVTLEKDGEKLSGVSTGDGPIDAAFHAIEQIIGHHYELDDFQVQAVTKGREAVGSSLIRLRAEGKLYSGNGISTDVVGACIRAYINALNKIVYEG